MVGLLPLAAVAIFDEDVVAPLPTFASARGSLSSGTPS